MPWPCYMVEEIEQTAPEPLPGGGSMTHRQWRSSTGDILRWKDLKPGAMWWDIFTDSEGKECRELVLKLPGGSMGSEWNIDEGKRLNAWRMPSTGPRPQWDRTGEPPNVTATPSINWVGSYHGWLQNGVLTDDCEGRRIPQ